MPLSDKKERGGGKDENFHHGRRERKMLACFGLNEDVTDRKRILILQR